MIHETTQQLYIKIIFVTSEHWLITCNMSINQSVIVPILRDRILAAPKATV